MVWFLTYAWHAFSMQNSTYVITFFLSSAALFTLKASISTVHFYACPQTNCLFVFSTIFKSRSTSLEHGRIVFYEETQKHWSPKCAHVLLKKDMEITLCCVFLSLWSLLSFFINCPLLVSLQAANVRYKFFCYTHCKINLQGVSQWYLSQPPQQMKDWWKILGVLIWAI